MYLLLEFIAAVEAKQDFALNLLDCMYLLHLAWDNVSTDTCFCHCGLLILVVQWWMKTVAV